MLHVIKFDKDNAEQMRFMFDVRSDIKVAQMLSGNPPKNYEEHTSWINKNIKDFGREIYILSNGNVLVGYFQMYNFKDTDECEVGYAVHPDHMGKGYGNVLVLSSIQRAKKHGIKNVVLYVKKNNDNAIHLYKKYGFVEKSIINNEIKMEQFLCH